jgi:hypothetical protein
MIPNRSDVQRFAFFAAIARQNCKLSQAISTFRELSSGEGNREPDFSSDGGLLFSVLTGYISASRGKAVSRFAGTSVLQFCINAHQQI